MGRLSGKTAMITGATGGIGAATVRAFLEEDARVLAVGRSEEKLAVLAETIGHDDALTTFATDATNEQGVRDSIAMTVERHGGLDIIFANAGTEGVAKPFDELSENEFRLPFEVNVFGVWLTLKVAAPVLRKQRKGSMIVTASTAGLKGFGGLSSYAASKHAVIGLTKCAALELAEHGVRVNAIAPGPIDNRMIHSFEKQMSPEDPAAVEAMLKEYIPMKRYGQNEDVAAMAIFLASDESAYSTGGVFTVDGGYTAT